jgi:hypothetical protein
MQNSISHRQIQVKKEMEEALINAKNKEKRDAVICGFSIFLIVFIAIGLLYRPIMWILNN